MCLSNAAENANLNIDHKFAYFKERFNVNSVDTDINLYQQHVRSELSSVENQSLLIVHIL